MTTLATPGIKNNCDNVEFIIDDHIMEIIKPTGISTVNFLEEDVKLDAKAPLDETLLDNLDETRLNNAITEMEAFDQEHECPRIPDIREDISSLDMTIKRELARKMNIAFEEAPSTIIYERKYTTIENALYAAQKLQHIFPIQTITKNYPWVEYIHNKIEPLKSRIRCGMCAKYTKHFRIYQVKYSKMSKAEGIEIKSTKEDNLDLIWDHLKTGQHTTILNKLQHQTIEEIMDGGYP